MNLFCSIEQASKEKGLPFVVIGGLAVIEHGYARTTTDLDLLVEKERRQDWHSLLSGMGYQNIHQGETFCQYARPEITDWPIDLMFVTAPTFQSMKAAAKTATVQGANLHFVSLEHLLALKLHALKYSHLRRFLKDFEDVIQLVRANRIDLRSPSIRDLFFKYGDAELYGKTCRACETA